jgi:ectoine hydroxylase-related dioxygenase (phytanoyl-CoA dioxygenase family)
MKSYFHKLANNGFAVVPGVVPPKVIDGLIAALGPAPHAIRNLIEVVPAAASLVRRTEVRGLMEEVLGPGAFVVRALLFDKVPGANWKVPWHQDMTIAVDRRRDVAGFGPWSEKAGIAHVQPPTDLLERMISLRIHLDGSGPGNGPLRVFPGSHRCGRLAPPAIEEWRAREAEVILSADRGGVIAMRPLLLHASSASERPGHRRVIHLECAAESLHGGLEWHGRW